MNSGRETRSSRSSRTSSGRSGRSRNSGNNGGNRKRIINSKPIIIVISVVLIFTAIFGGWYFINHNRLTPENTVRSFIYAGRHSNFNGMLNYIDPTEKKLLNLVMGDMTASEADSIFASLSPVLAEFIKNDLYAELNPEIIDSNKNNYKATVTVKIELNGQNRFYEFHLIKVRCQWYIQYITELEQENLNESIQ